MRNHKLKDQIPPNGSYCNHLLPTTKVVSWICLKNEKEIERMVKQRRAIKIDQFAKELNITSISELKEVNFKTQQKGQIAE